MIDKPHNAADPVAVAEQKALEERVRFQEKEDIRKIIGTPEGIRLFRRMFVAGRVLSTSFTGNATTYFLEGHRNLVNMFLADVIEAAPEALPILLTKDLVK